MSEREDKWVLVPVRPDWSRAMLNALGRGTIGDPRGLYRDMLAARPAIPDDVWEQMVERGARAIHEREMGKGYPIWEEGLADAAACLRAALGISDE